MAEVNVSEPFPPEQPRPRSWRSRIGLSVVLAATIAASPQVMDNSVETDTKNSPFYISSDCGSSYVSNEQLAAAELWALNQNKPTSSEISDKEDRQPPDEVERIETKRNFADFEVVGKFELPSYPVEVVVVSDDEMMTERVDKDALEQVLLWPYQHAKQIDIDVGVREQAIEAIECDYQLIKDGAMNDPFVLVIPSKFDESCLRDREVVTPAVACGPDGTFYSWSFDLWRMYRVPHAAIVTSGDRPSNSDVELAEVIQHEWNHYLDLQLRGIFNRNPDSKEREAFAYLLENTFEAKFDFSDFDLIDTGSS